MYVNMTKSSKVFTSLKSNLFESNCMYVFVCTCECDDIEAMQCLRRRVIETFKRQFPSLSTDTLNEHKSYGLYNSNNYIQQIIAAVAATATDDDNNGIYG